MQGKTTSELLEGIGQFNRGEYYECHETLEEIWMHEQGEYGASTRAFCK